MPFKMNDDLDENIRQRLIWRSGAKVSVALACYTMGLMKFYQSPKLLVGSSILEYVFIYLVAILVVGIPATFLEMILSQYSSKSVIKSWGFCPLFKGIGYAKVTTLYIFQIYYNVLNGYVLLYVSGIFKKSVPWKNCSASWIHDKCHNFTSNFENEVSNITKSSTQQFWLYKVLNTDESVHILSWPHLEIIAYYLAHLFLLYMLTYKGPKILNKILPLLLTLSLIKLTILLCVTSYTKGALIGLRYLFNLNVKLDNLIPWKKDSLSAKMFDDILLSLGLGLGGLSFLGSKFSFRQSTNAHALTINVMSLSFTIISSIILYNIYGILSYNSHIPLENMFVAKNGNFFSQPLFDLVPNGLRFLPGNEKVWIFMFFGCIYITGLASSIIMLSTILEVFYDPKSGRNNLFASVLSMFLTCAFGIVLQTNSGSLIREYLNDAILTTLLPILVFIECAVLIFCYGLMNFFDDIHFMFGHRPSAYWHVTLILVPFLTSTLMIFPIINFYTSEKYAHYMKFEYMNVLQKCIFCFVFVWIPFMCMVHIIKKGNWRLVFKSAQSWGPENNMLKKSRLSFNDDDSTKEFVYQKNLLAMKLNINDSDETYY